MKNLAKIRICFTFAVFPIFGCTTWNQGDGHYQVYVDKEFSQEQQTWVDLAVDDWVEAIGTKVITFELTNNWKQDNNLISISPSTFTELSLVNNDPDEISSKVPGSGTVGHTTFEGTDSVIQVATDGFIQDQTYFGQVTAHEIGHAIGLVHTDPGELMWHEMTGQAHKPTCRDLIQFCGIWACDPLELPGCLKNIRLGGAALPKTSK